MVAGELMKGEELSITGMERGEETLEELEAKMGPAAVAMVDGMADDVIKRSSKANRKFYSRNRKAWDRMNRESKLNKINLGMERMYNLVSGKGFKTDAEV